MRYVVYYHGCCADGFAGMMVVRRWLLRDYNFDFVRNNVEFIASQYGDEPLSVEPGDNIIMVDFSFPRAVIEDMQEKADWVVVIDHHKTAEENLKDLISDDIVFDMNHSGAVLAWKYFFEFEPVPLFLKYIEDYDLWKFELLRSRELSAGLKSMPMLQSNWDSYLNGFGLDQLANDGEAILRYQQQQIGTIMRRKLPMIELDGYRVPCINATNMISEIGDALANDYPFVVMYFDTEDKRVFSMRSSKSGDVDVSLIAKKRGGGGHRTAAGFSIPKPPLGI